MTVKKVTGFANIEAWLVGELAKISGSKWSEKRKETAAKKVGEQAREWLWVKVAERRPVKEKDKYRKVEDGTVTATTHNRYVTRMRRNLEEMGLVHWSLDNALKSLEDKYPEQVKYLHNIDKKSYRTIFKSIDEIQNKLDTALKRTKKDGTKKAIESLKKDLKDLPVQNPAMLTLARKGDELANMNKRERDRKTKYQKRPRKFSGMEIIELIYTLIKSDTWEDLTLGLSLATGRRSVEVFHFGQFEVSSKHSLKFTGMRKSKVKSTQEFKIPALIDSDLVVDALNRLRSTTRYTSLIDRLNGLNLHEAEFARKINQSIAADLNKLINVKMNPENKQGLKWVFKDSRAIYARMAYATYTANAKKAGRVPQQEINYFKETLLHTDMNETLSYLQFQLTDADKLNAYQIDKAKHEGESLTFADRLPLLEAMREIPEINQYKSMVAIHRWVESYIASNPDAVVNGGVIRREYGGSPNRVTAYARLLVELKLDKPNQIVENKPAKKKKEDKPEKVIKKKRIEITMTFYADIEVEGDSSMDDSDWMDATEEAADSAIDDLSIWDYSDKDWNEI
ncbi:hypothetical protein BCT93_12350 [Vibrio lentus]|nr:hypothetical protein BCT93_12350 [Vibrio lentus]